MDKSELGGVFPAVVTPLRDGKPDLKNLQRHIQTLINEGVDGILLLGTTGEGPSMGSEERAAIIEAAARAAKRVRILVGTGRASLTEAIITTRKAYELGADVTVVVPPFYYKSVSDVGVVQFYQQLLDEAVPDDRFLMLYHIPKVTGIPITTYILEELMKYGGKRVIGVKDSSGNLEHGRELCKHFPELRIFVGHDRVFLDSLEAGAAGCITAGANVLGPLAVRVYHAFQNGENANLMQHRLSAARAVLDGSPPLASALKSLLAMRYTTKDGWEVRPPLVPLADEQNQLLFDTLVSLELPEISWLRQEKL